jgi:OOP family OmpA-OmpF porin
VLDDSDSVFAYQAIAGLGYHLNWRTQLFADYRYFAAADSSLSTRTNVSVVVDYADYTLLFGLRFSFAEPKQAPKSTTKAEPVQQVATAVAPAAPVSAALKVTPVPPAPVVEVPRTYLNFSNRTKLTSSRRRW